MDGYDIRKPTEVELRQLATLFNDRWYQDGNPDDEQDVFEQLQGTCIMRVDNYISDGPGYAGPIYTIVWGGDPSFVTIIGYRADAMYVIVESIDCESCIDATRSRDKNIRKGR